MLARVAVGCAMFAIVGACTDPGATPPVVAKSAADSADQTMFGVRLVLSDHGV